jgi:glycosyltransferase involved in cell wall biosynthesis
MVRNAQETADTVEDWRNESDNKKKRKRKNKKSFLIGRIMKMITNSETKITFILPTIARVSLYCAVDSLLKQSNPNWKCVIIFDGMDVIDGLAHEDNPPITLITDERFTLVSTPKTGGFHKFGGNASSVRNVGLDYVTTEWIGFLDDDDTLHPDYVQTLYEKYQNYDVVVWRMKYRNGAVLPPHDLNEIIGGKVGISYCYKNQPDMRFIDTNGSEDYHFLKKLVENKNNYVITDEVFYNVEHYF